jgi:periplasmic divalent cation tolerance protein
MNEILLVLTNVPDNETAIRISRELIEQRVAACVNILPGVLSVYRWQGAIEETHEVSLLIKTTQDAYPKLEAALKTMHPYEVPEILALPIFAGFPTYLDWVAAETQKSGNVQDI